MQVQRNYSHIFALISVSSVISFVWKNEETGSVCVQWVLTVCFCSTTLSRLFDNEPVLPNFIPKWLLWNKVSASPMPVYQHQNKWSYKQQNLNTKIFHCLVKTLPWFWILEGHNNFNTLCSENLKRHYILKREICRLQPTEMNILQILTYLLTYSMEQSPSWEANWFCS